MTDLLLIVPTRGRRDMCGRLLDSVAATADDTDVMVVTDPDDESYAGMDFGEAVHGALAPREPLSGKLNRTVDAALDDYDVIMWAGDDHVFSTPHWDTVMLKTLSGMGGSGWVYPDDKRRRDVPEIWMCSADVIRVLGWFANPLLCHYYLDNTVAELGKRTGLLRWCPDAVAEHLHYQVAPETARDVTYRETEDTWGRSDADAFARWQADVMPFQVSMLRREFNPDTRWVREEVRGAY